MKTTAKTLIFSLFLFGQLSYGQTKIPKVLFLGIDGTRSDALQIANTPTLDSLMQTGLHTYDSWHLGVSVSGPSWSSMLTGVWEAKHRVTNNSYGGADYNNWPYLATRVKEVRPNLRAVQIITWNPMDDASKGTGGQVFNSGWDLSIDVGNQGQDLIPLAAEIQLQDPNLDFLFAYIQDNDGAGHATGFSPNSPTYMNAIEHTDRQVKRIINALEARPTYDQEEWLVISSTDHGGIGTGHGGNSDQERSIWWFMSAPFLYNKEIFSADPGSYQMPGNPVNQTMVSQVPVLTDIAVTIIDHLLPDLDAPEVRNRWNLDGQSWLTPEYYDSTMYHNQKGGLVISVPEKAMKEQAVKIYPNPANNEVRIVKSTAQNETLHYEIHDLSGRRVKTGNISSNEVNVLNISELKPGYYSITVRGKSMSPSKSKFVVVE